LGTNNGCAGMSNGSATVFASGDPGGYTYLWLPSGGTSSVGTGMSPQNYTCLVTGNCGSTVSTIVTMLAPSPMVVSANANPVTVCAGKSVTLSAFASGGAFPVTYSWSCGSTGSVIVVNPTVTTTFFAIATDANLCSEYDSTTVVVLPPPNLSVNSGSICQGNAFTIIPQGALTYTITGGSFNVSPFGTTTYSLYGTGTNNCDAISPAICVVTVDPPAFVTAPNGTICIGDSFTLNPGGAATYTFSTGPIVSPTTNTSYTISGTSAAGCPASPAICFVDVKSIPNINVVASTTNICNGGTVMVNATGAANFVWQPGNLVGATQSISITTSQVFTVTGSNGGSCFGTKTLAINASNPDLEEITASSTLICKGDTVTLSLLAASNFTWSNGGNTPRVFVHPPVTSTFSLTAADNNGCLFYRTISIAVDPDCFPKVYNVVSPNGDGINDFLFIENVGKFKKRHVIIFNRWGQIVFETNEYDNVNVHWPAKDSAPKYVSSTYFYFVELDDLKPMKGWIELIKD
jgi:gliding motility-associated-like protein